MEASTTGAAEEYEKAKVYCFLQATLTKNNQKKVSWQIHNLASQTHINNLS